MTLISKTMTIDLPAERAWEILADFGGLHKFHPKVKSSPLLSAKGPGVGCARRCNFYDGTSVVERVIQWDEGTGFTMEMSEFSMPIQSANAFMKVIPAGKSKSEVTIAMDVVPKYGLFGVVMANVVLRPFAKSVFTQVIRGLEWHGKTGALVGEGIGKLPAPAAAGTAS